MKARIMLLIASLLTVLPSVGRADVDYYWAGYAYGAAASWSTPTAYADLWVAYGAAAGQTNWYGNVYIYDKLARRIVCSGSWIVNPGEVVVDPALTNGIVSVPRSPCGAITVTLTGSQDPPVPGTGSWAQAWHSTYTFGGFEAGLDGWAGGWWGRDATVSGKIGNRTFPASPWGWLANSVDAAVGARAYTPTGVEHGN